MNVKEKRIFESDGGWSVSRTLIRSSRRAIIASLLVAVLGAVAIVPGIAAPNEVLEISHKGVRLIGVRPDPRADYDVPVIVARQAVEREGASQRV